jgi:hypothetical protein
MNLANMRRLLQEDGRHAVVVHDPFMGFVTCDPFTRLAVERENARARLLSMQVMLGVEQADVDKVLGDEAERECGDRANISTAVIDRVARRLMFGEGLTGINEPP